LNFSSAGRVGALLILIIAISACSSIGKTPLSQQSQLDWTQYQLQAGRINQWDLRGRAAIFVDDEVHNVGLSWQRNEDEFVIMLEAPFGQGVIRIESISDTNRPVKLSLPDGQVVYGLDAETTLQSVVGWSIPVNGLVFWIKGLPQKSASFSHQLYGDGRLKSLTQNGWRINFLDYFDIDGPARGLPRKLYLKHERLALKIVIERWQKPESISSDRELFPEFN